MKKRSSVLLPVCLLALLCLTACGRAGAPQEMPEGSSSVDGGTDRDGTLYHFTITAGEGGTIPAGMDQEINGDYAPGEQIHLIVRSMPDFRFEYWTSSGGGSFSDPEDSGATFTMPACDTTVTAVFAPIVSAAIDSDELVRLVKSKLSDETFGGLYFDGEGVLHVNVTCPTDSSFLWRTGGQIVYHQVDHSLAWLEELMHKLTSYAGFMRIVILDANDVTNQLDITFQAGCDSEEARSAVLGILGLPADSDICHFSALREGTVFELT